ncbi:hypothetical protein [Haloarchaeobius sp. FL176]|uniref:hypothetical protein n=1 Tax=Haloarchaeobius sp. FL176 TaxID=2967129 RepID=UPI002147F613|nr:hypothetical protein [Haloarchaeobius sp. FL176]
MPMERRKSKFLFDYLPGNTFNHAESDLSGLVSRIHEDRDEAGRSKASELPDAYILKRISRHAAAWPNWADLSLSADDASIVTPGAANFEVFPRTFECGRCGTVTQLRWEEAKDFPRDDAVTCGRCSAQLRDHHQMQFVSVCHCGQIQEIYVPEHCGAGMALRNPGTGFDNAYWRCTGANCEATVGFRPSAKCFNPDCDYGQQARKMLPHSASQTFYPQTERLINVRKDLDTLLSNDQYQIQIVSDYLLERSGNTGPSEQEKLSKAMELLENNEVDGRDEALELAEERLTVDIQAHRDETKHFLTEQLSDVNQIRLSEELFEYLSVVNPEYDEGDRISSYTFADLAEDAQDTHLEPETVDRYCRLRDKLNLEEVRLIKNFPITTVSYGYSRIKPSPTGLERQPSTEGGTNDSSDQPAETDGGTTPVDEDGDPPALLNLFSSGQWGDTEVFARTNDAEAVMLTLDKETVVEWLRENDVIDEPDIDDLDRWFLANVGHPSRFEAIDPAGDPVSRAAYSLLHSFSHSVIQSIGKLSGYGRDSLVEHLLPRTMSVIIYKRSDTDFNLGSIFTLFEERFPDVIDQLDETDYCTYDTVCRRDHNCACEDCLFVSSVTCQNSNQNLSRSVYFGGPFDGPDIVGFNGM